MAKGPDTHARALIEAWDVISRYRWRFITPAFLVMAGVLAVSLFLPRKYKGEAIFERQTDMVLTEVVQRGAVQTFDNLQQSTIEQIAGEPAIDELIETLEKKGPAIGVGHLSRAQLEALRLDLNRKVNVAFEISAPNLDRMNVTYISEDPNVSRAVVNTLVQNYITRTRDQIDRHLRQAAHFFEKEVGNKRTLIEDLENRKLTFEIQHAELLPDSPGSVQEVLTDAQLQQITLEQQKDAATMRVEALTAMVDKLPETVPTVTTAKNPELFRLEEKLSELNSQFEVYTGEYKMTDRHPDLAVLREQIAGVKKEIANTPAEVVTQKRIDTNRKREHLEMQLSQAQLDLQSIQKQIESLNQQIDRLNAESADIFPVRSEYQKLDRQIDQARRELAFWEDNLGRVHIALAAETGDRGVRLTFIKPCEQIRRPTSPDLVQVLFLALLVGLTAGGANVFLAYRTDEAYSDAEDLAEAMGLSLFGSVSEIISSHQRRVRRLTRLILYPLNLSAMAAVILLLAGLLYLDLERPEWLETDAGIAPAEIGLNTGPTLGGPLAGAEERYVH